MKSVQFKIRCELKEPMLGTVPRNNEALVEQWLQEVARNRGKVSAEQLAEELHTVPPATIEDMESRSWDGFHYDEVGPFVYDYLVKGFLKEAANVLALQTGGEEEDKKKDKDGNPIEGVSGLRNKTEKAVFVTPRRIHIYRNGSPISVPDGYLERPVRIMDRSGQRVALKRSDRIDTPASLEFTITVLVPSVFAATAKSAESRLRNLLSYGGFKGFGEFRNGGYGSFTFTLTPIE